MLKPKNDEKAKNRAGVMQFLAIWIAGHIGGWLLAIMIYEAFENFFQFGGMANALLVAVVPGMIIALVEMLIVERGLKKSMRGWLPVSLFGWLASFFSYLMFSQMSYAVGSPIIQIVILFLPAAIAQFLWLSRRVKNAWLWVGAAIVSALVFVLPLNVGNEYEYGNQEIMQFVFLALSAILQGAVTGLTMYTLQQQRKDNPQKAKLAAVDDISAEAAARLQAENAMDDETEWEIVAEDKYSIRQ
jgi:hypothetical protein